jgi:hypothetical protein
MPELTWRAERLIDEFNEGADTRHGIANVLKHLAYAFDVYCDSEYETMVGVPVSTLDELVAELTIPLPPEPEPTDDELLALMPQLTRDNLAQAARALAQQAGTGAGVFRVSLNTDALEYARAVLEHYGDQ